MWLLVSAGSDTFAIEVSGTETVREFHTLLATNYPFREDFVLACRTYWLSPDDQSTLNSLGFLKDMTVISLQLRKSAGTAQTDRTLQFTVPPPAQYRSFDHWKSVPLEPETVHFHRKERVTPPQAVQEPPKSGGCGVA
jgi:hypothetical protein